jgi:hypothetical protein
MKKQTQHVRKYKSGRKTLVNLGLKRRETHKIKHSDKGKRKSFFGSKLIPERWVVFRDLKRAQPVWSVKNPKDRDLTYFQLVEYGNYLNSPYGDADNDGITNIFDKKPLSARNRKQVPPTIKKGNTKLTSVIGIFSLPRYYTCPGKTELCQAYCYAEPPERIRPAVVYSRNKNLAWSLRPNFVDVSARMIKSMNLPWFRIHESGDFYNQEYFNKWAEIARRNPKTKFLAYIKNWNLDISKAPKNFTVRYSSDISSKHIRQDLPACYIGVKKPDNFFKCKAKCEPGYCMACWDKKIDVYIPVHSIGKDKIDKMFFKQFSPVVPQELIGRNISKGYHPSKTIVGNTKL